MTKTSRQNVELGSEVISSGSGERGTKVSQRFRKKVPGRELHSPWNCGGTTSVEISVLLGAGNIAFTGDGLSDFNTPEHPNPSSTAGFHGVSRPFVPMGNLDYRYTECRYSDAN